MFSASISLGEEQVRHLVVTLCVKGSISSEHLKSNLARELSYALLVDSRYDSGTTLIEATRGLYS